MKKKKQTTLHTYIDEIQGDLCKIVGMYLGELKNREKLEGAPINQVASALGTIIEKFSKHSRADEDNGILEELITSLKNDDSSSK
ncbi:MAG: hypothetical protein WCX81_03310 [Monoglobales bacterium]